MREMHVRVTLRSATTTIVATEETSQGATTVLKAALDGTPSHPRALQWLLEAIALWQGAKVHAVLAAAERTTSCGMHLWGDWLPDHGGALFTLELEHEPVRRRRRDRVGTLRPRARQLTLFRRSR